MKKILITILPVVFIFCSCKKDKDNDNNSTVTKYTINSADFPAPGDVFIMAIDTTQVDTFSLGTAGEGKTWSFLGLGNEGTDTTRFTDPTTHPGYSHFNTATFVMKPSDGGTIDIFGKLSSDKAEIIGMWGKMGSDTIWSTTVDNLLMMKFPYQYGSNYTDTAWINPIFTTLNMGGNDYNGKIEMRWHAYSNVDASGSVTTPTNTYQCIRIYQEQITVQVISVDFLGTGNYTQVQTTKDTSRTYSFVNKDVGYSVLDAEVNAQNKIIKISYLK